MVLSFNSTSGFSAGEITPASSISGDFNGDGNLDLIVSSSSYFALSQPSAFSILLGNGTTGANAFGTPRSVLVDQQGGNIQALATGDFNKDGKLDVLTAQSKFSFPANSTGSIAVLLGDGTGKFAAPVLSNTNAIQDLTVADFNGDGNLDVAAIESGTVTILLGNGTGLFQATNPILIRGSAQSAIGSGDFNRDGKVDFVIVGQEATNSVATVFLNDGTGSFSASTPVIGQFFNDSDGFVVTDLNRDGQLDVVTNQAVLLGDGTGKLRVAGQLSVSNTLDGTPGLGKPVIADFNSDGNLDVAQSGYSGRNSNGVFVSLGNGSGGLSQGALVGKSDAKPTVGDFNKDGKPDFAVVSNGAVSLLVNNTAGTDALVLSGDNGSDSSSSTLLDASSETDGNLSVELSKKKLQLNGATVSGLSLSGVTDVIGTKNKDVITGSNANNTLRGNDGNDTLNGLSGDDRLVGGAGNDRLIGGKGSDRFVFRLEEQGIYLPFNRALGTDRIVDFTSSKDKIALNDTTFAALTSKISFAAVDSVAAAKRSNALITYIQSTGKLYYNENGSRTGFGAGGVFAVLDNKAKLNVKDFIIAHSANELSRS